MLLGSMNRQMNLPALQRIAMEFERENEVMDERQEMMDDAVDEATGLEDEEESDDIVKEVLDEIGVNLSQEVSHCLSLSDIPQEGANAYLYSWEKLQQIYRRQLLARQRFRKLLAVGEEAPMMTISKQDLTAFDDDSILRSTTLLLMNTNQTNVHILLACLKGLLLQRNPFILVLNDSNESVNFHSR